MRSSIGWLILVLAPWLTNRAVAAAVEWSDATGNSLWSDPANWSTGSVPTSNDDVHFDLNYFAHGNGIVDLGGAAWAVRTIGFSNPANTVLQFQNGTLISPGTGYGSGTLLFYINLGTTSSWLGVMSNGSTQYLGDIGGTTVPSNNFSLQVSGGVFTADNSYTGATTIAGSVPMVLTGANGSIRNSSQMTINGGILELDNRQAVNSNRVGDSAPITCLTAATITFDGNSTSASSESLGAVTLWGSVLNLNVYSNGAAAELGMQSVTRLTPGVLELSLSNTAGAAPGRAVLHSISSLGLVGGGGSAGSTNRSIVPYAMGAGASFVTYDSGLDGQPGTGDDVGLRPLNVATEYLTTIPASMPTSNVRIATGQTVSQSATINALAINGAILTIGGSQQIALASGALSLSGNSSQSAGITGGSINFSGREAVIYADGLASGTQPRYVVNSQLQNTSSITKFGTGTLVLAQPTSLSVELDIQEGMIASQANGALGTGDIVIGGSQYPNAVPIGIAFESVNQTFSNAIGNYSSATLNVADGINVTYSGTMSALMTKSGAGTLILSPQSSLALSGTYNSLDNGTLRVDTAAHVTIGVGYQARQTATLGGSGVVDAVQLGPNGILWPGAGGQNGSDILSIGNLETQVGTFHVSLNGTTAGAQYDQIEITQNVNLYLTNLEVGIGYDAHVGDHFMIIDNLTPDPVFGTFAGLPEGATFSADGDQFQITYKGGGYGNDVVLTVLSTPEPSAMTFATACLAGLLLRRQARGRDLRG